jgi:hypothetical protein
MTSRQILMDYGTGQQRGDPFPLQFPNSIGLRGHDWIDALVLNGVTHGSPFKGDPTDQISLNPNDYWNRIEIHGYRTGERPYVHFLRFGSTAGDQVVNGPQRQMDYDLDASGIYLLRVGGRAHDALDSIVVEYIENYQPSKAIDLTANAVLDVRTGGLKITTYTDSTYQMQQAYERTVQQAVSTKMNVSASGEFFAKFSLSTGVSTTETTREDIKKSVQESLKFGQKIEQTIPSNETAFLISPVCVMKDSDGNSWLYPTEGATWIKLDPSKYSRLIGYYDLAAGVEAATGLHIKIHNGYRVLTK